MPLPVANELLTQLGPGWRNPMNGLIFQVLIITGVFFAGSVQADIYQWTDKNGVKHFTNYKPPAHATILMKTKEVPYDEAADRARIEADRQYQLEVDRLELAKREAEIAQREAAAERKVRDAERYADETMRAADEYRDDSIYDRWYYRSGSWGTYNYGHSRYKRSYYRNHTTSIYWKDRRHGKHYKRKFHKKSSYRDRKNYHSRSYRYKKHEGFKRYRPSHHLRSSGRRTHGGYHGNSRSSGRMGGRHFGRGTFGRHR